MACSTITVEELEEIRLSYDIPASVTLRAPGLEERADDPPEGFVAIYEPAMYQSLCLSMHQFFHEVIAEAGGSLTPTEFESIYQSCRSAGWYNVSPRPGQKWGTVTDSPNKVHNWKERFFFIGGDWEFIPEDLLPHVSIPRRFEELDNGKPPIPKRDQGELRSKWEEVRALRSDFRSLSNMLKNNNLLASCGLMAFRFKGVLALRLARPASGKGSSAQALRHEVFGPSQEVQDTTPSSTIPPPPSKVQATIHSPPPSSSNLHIDSTPPKDKRKRVVEGVCEAPTQKKKALTTVERLMSAFESFDAEEAKSKKLFEDLKAMGLEKRRAAEASREHAKEALKLAKDRTLVAETVIATANSSLGVVVADKKKSLATVKLELEKVRAERKNAEAKAVEAYQDVFMDTPEYQDLAQRLMTIGKEQLVEWIMETHPEYDISFLRKAPTEAPVPEAIPDDNPDKPHHLLRRKAHHVPTLNESAGHLN
ncbi:Uncharacterized protein Adt_35295 [Abeliophyllum distichum]|uniref:Transposase n=1 Tax=Abeliophyllum distichum TaxID=126358 RepID=A0ABD1QEA5_9LAMI